MNENKLMMLLSPLSFATLLTLHFLGCSNDPTVVSDTGGDFDDAGDLSSDVIDSPAWQTVFENLDGALLSVWGSGATDVWTVGSDPGDGMGPYLIHYNADVPSWTRIDASTVNGDLWWIWGVDDQSEVWMAGSGGLVASLDRADMQLTIWDTPGEEQLFGIVPFGDEVIAVGGDVREQRGVVWTLVDGEFVPDTSFPALVLDRTALFKVFATSEDDVWAVGLDGSVVHRTGGTWSEVTEASGTRLFTVHGNGVQTLVVGGGVSGGLVLGESASDLTDITPEGAPQLNGVFVNDDGSAALVGVRGAIWTRSSASGSFTEVAGTPLFADDYHAVYVDRDGGIWTVGGFVISMPLSRGRMTYYGPPLPTASFD